MKIQTIDVDYIAGLYRRHGLVPGFGDHFGYDPSGRIIGADVLGILAVERVGLNACGLFDLADHVVTKLEDDGPDRTVYDLLVAAVGLDPDFLYWLTYGWDWELCPGEGVPRQVGDPDAYRLGMLSSKLLIGATREAREPRRIPS